MTDSIPRIPRIPPIPIPHEPGNFLHIRGLDVGDDDRAVAQACDLHAWPTEGLAKRLVQAMHDRHGKGGVNACRECIQRATESLPPRPKPR